MINPNETIRIPVREVRVGDLVDLEGDAALGHHPEVEFEYCRVYEIEREIPDCTVLYFDTMAAGYDPETMMTVKTPRETEDERSSEMLPIATRILNIQFSVLGHHNQRIALNPDCDLTDQELLVLLNSGIVWTSLLPGGDVVRLDDDGSQIVIGKVVGYDPNMNYSDFALRTPPD